MQSQTQKFNKDFTAQIQHNTRQMENASQQIQQLREDLVKISAQKEQFEQQCNVLEQQLKQERASIVGIRKNYEDRCLQYENEIKTYKKAKKVLNIAELGILNEKKLSEVGELKRQTWDRYN